MVSNSHGLCIRMRRLFQILGLVTSAVMYSTASEPTETTGDLGGVRVVNNMARDVFLWSVSDVPSSMVVVPSGECYQEDWRLNPDGGGISIKMSTTPDMMDILQYEYTLIPPIAWWDVSEINMSPGSEFQALGFTVTSDNASCPTVTCGRADAACPGVYHKPDDDYATHACHETTHMTLTLGSPTTNGTPPALSTASAISGLPLVDR